MQRDTVCIIGGSGFVGNHLATRLVRDGYGVKILTRRRERHRELLVVPGIEVVEANPFDADRLAEVLPGAAAVVNLTGVLNATKWGRTWSWGFDRVHAFLPGVLAAVCKRVGVPRLLHMSALNAGLPGNRSAYLRSKGLGEAKVLAAESDTLHVTCLRPSVIFGPGDRFINRFADLLRLSPVLPLGCSTSRFAPVHVGDVVDVMSRAIADPASYGKSYDLCGPRAYSLRQLVELTAQGLGLERNLWSLGPTASLWQARLMQLVPGKPFSVDNYHALQSDSVCRRGYEFPFGITPTPLEAVLPKYIGKLPPRNRYMDYRAQARR